MSLSDVDMDGNSEVSNSELKQFISEMKQAIMTKLDENRQEIIEMKEELKTLKSTVSDVETATSNHAERLDELEMKTLPQIKATVDKQVHELEEKLLLLELHDRKNNVLVYGVEEKENEDVKTVLLDVWHQNFAVSNDQLERGIVMTDCHRLPQSQHAKRDKDGNLPPRPIIVKFGYTHDSHFFTNTRNMKRGNHKIRVLQDLPPVMKRERGRLSSIAYSLRKEQHLMTRITVRKTKVILEYKPKDKPSARWMTYRDGQ